MFNIGPMELLVLAVVGLIVLGPDRLPGLARDAARMIRTLRDLATGARTQLRDELGPELAELQELRNLNPRTALQRAILGDEDFRSGFRDDLRDVDPRRAVDDAMRDEPEHDSADEPVSMRKAPAPEQRPLGRGERAPYDADAT